MARPRFSLRWLLMVVLVVAIYFGGFSHAQLLSLQREAALEERAAMMAIQVHVERARAEQLNQQLRQAAAFAQGAHRKNGNPSP